tara:strand:- start:313 stop:1515 length:1203 start_codon:yes stop_codon:yes gene_type:complete
LSAAVNAQRKDFNVNIFESSGFAGGRCRSYFDKKMGIEIDNGNHLVLSANKNFFEYCQFIESVKTIKKIEPIFNFFNVKDKKHWNLNLLDKKYPTWIFNKKKRIPNSSVIDYFAFLKFSIVNKKTKVSDLIQNSNIFKSFWEPFTLGIMNTHPDEASAKVLSNVLKKTLFKGRDFCYIYQPKINWHNTLIQPTIDLLKKKDNKISFNNTLKKIIIKNNNVEKLIFEKNKIDIYPDDHIIFALPLSGFGKLFPDQKIPLEYNTILNIHFKLPESLLSLFKSEVVGMVDSLSQWIFVKNKHISVTVSDANKYDNLSANEIADLVWNEICIYLKKTIDLQEFRVIKEKKATYHQSPKNNSLIKNISNTLKNVSLAGDWTQIELPCTIEGSILSGKKAVELLKI